MKKQNEAVTSGVGSRVENAIITVDSFANGIAIGQAQLEPGQDPRDCYSLRMRDTGVARLRSRYLLDIKNPFAELENNLSKLSKRGILGTSTIYFGTSTDPFIPFQGKFDASMKFLDIFSRYTPGRLIVQTRSPLIVLALPVLQKLGARAAVTIGLETHLEESVRRYTPGLPRVSERLKTINTLRKFRIETTIQVSPLLPYGDWKEDAADFANILADHADYIFIRSITDGTESTERRLRADMMVKRIAQDRKFHYLRADSANPLITEIELIAPLKLGLPKRESILERQLSIFAA